MALRIKPATKEIVERVKTKRKHLSVAQKLRLLNERGWRCAANGCDLSNLVYRDAIEFDHIHGLEAEGPNDLDNWQALCIPCHRKKTAAEAALRAKVRRHRNEGKTFTKKKATNKLKAAKSREARAKRDVKRATNELRRL